MTVEASRMVALLRAAPYEIRGAVHQGKVHCIKEAERTYCGLQLRYTGGSIEPGGREEITCKGCLRSLESAEQRQQDEKAWEQHRVELLEQRLERTREWWDRYREHLASPAWRAKRQKVLERAAGLCEGCRQALPTGSAVHVHHLTYEHLGDELLYELVALCVPCHQKAHPYKEIGLT